jgi:putative SOS response-associated peptidase YedK
MCGRFALTSSAETVAEQFSLEQPPLLAPRYNIAPTQPVAAIRLSPHTGKRELALFSWGLIPSWAKDIKMGAKLINARSETVAEKPSFRASFKRRRCLIPADGFYEWKKDGKQKQPMYMHAINGRLWALAGLWETWIGAEGSEIDSCTILTTTPNELMESIHDRMPVILEPEDYDLWLKPGPNPDQGLHLLRPYPAEKMHAYPVSSWVNAPQNDGPRCIAPLA